MIPLEFILTSLLIIMLPGTGVVYTVQLGLTGSKYHGIAAALGCTLGIVPHLGFSFFGLSTIIHFSAQLFRIIRFLGVSYLLYLAWQTWDSAKKPLDFEQRPEQKNSNYGQVIIKAIGLNLLNPNLTVFFLSFLPQFLGQESQNQIVSLAVLSGIFMGLTFLVFTIYALVAQVGTKVLHRRPKISQKIQKGFAILFGVQAIRLMAE